MRPSLGNIRREADSSRPRCFPANWRRARFDYLFIPPSPENDVQAFHWANGKWKALCAHHGLPQMGSFPLRLFPFVTALRFLEIYPQSVLLKPAFLKKLSFKNVKHTEKWKSQKTRLFTATPLGFPRVSGSPCRLDVLEVTSTIDLAGNPLWSGSEWSPHPQSRPFPRRQCSMCSRTLRTIRQSRSKRRSPFKEQEKERAFGKFVKGTLFSSLRGGAEAGREWRGFQWIWWRPSEGGSQ